MVHNKILVPVSFSDQSLIALEQSYNLARYTNSVITLLHVAKGSVKDAENKLNKIAQDAATKTGIVFDTMVVKGNAYKQILKTAKKLNALLIIMGFNSSRRIKNIGYTSFRVVRESACPVITIKGKQHRNGCQNIVLPLDLTKETREKVKKAIEFAKFFNSAIRIISVRLPSERRHENKLIAYSHQVQKFIKGHGIHCTIKTLEGEDIAGLVMNYAKEVEADLIMIMTKQELSLKELFFVGTTAQRVVNNSNIPVLSIRPTKKGYSSGGVNY